MYIRPKRVPFLAVQPIFAKRLPLARLHHKQPLLLRRLKIALPLLVTDPFLKSWPVTALLLKE